MSAADSYRALAARGRAAAANTDMSPARACYWRRTATALEARADLLDAGAPEALVAALWIALDDRSLARVWKDREDEEVRS